MKKYIFTSFTWLLCLLMVSSCVNEHITTDMPESGANQKMVSFLVSVAGAKKQKSETRALTAEDENTVKTIEVLLFDQDGIYSFEPIYSDNIAQKPNGELSFTIKVPVGTYNMVVLANARPHLKSVLNQLKAGVSTKEEVLSKLVLENTEKWVVNTNQNDYQYIPMSGDIDKVVVATDNTIVKNVSLVRMLSKIDVILSDEAKSKFNLTDIRLYNYSAKGQITPNQENWFPTFDKVLKPSLPDDFKSLKGSFHTYEGLEISKQAGRGFSCMNTIYLFEAPKGVAGSGMENNTCLVIGGYYENETTLSYYRIDLANNKAGTAGITYLELLRNHQYTVLVQKITGAGLNNPDVAFETKPINVESNVVEWNEGEIHDIVFDGQYLLGVSQSEYVFNSTERTVSSNDNSLIITTDYPLGWTIDKIVDSAGGAVAWLSSSVEKGGAYSTETKLVFGENTSKLRIAFIHISAGRLKHIVSVEQTTEKEFFISTVNVDGEDINEVNIGAIDGKPVEAQSFSVKWNPSSASLEFNLVPYLGNGFVFADEGFDRIESQGSLAGGEKKYTIKPVDFTSAEVAENPFVVRSSFVIYSLTVNGVSINKTVALNHKSLNLFHREEASYNLDGDQHAFYVRSNMAYTIEKKNDPENVLTLMTTQGEQNITESGHPILFKLKEEEGDVKTQVALLIKSPTGQFEPKEVLIHCAAKPMGALESANSYMAVRNGGKLLIPVARCNEWIKDALDPTKAYRLGDAEVFKPVFIWTDNQYGMNESGCIKSLSVVGNGPSGYLVVEPGNNVGNAVVGITNAAGQILWSWHIWVSSDKHSTSVVRGQFMDRNLGAITNSANIEHVADTYGMLYQWGRKDPFVGVLTVNKGDNSVANNSFDKDGKIIQLPAFSDVTVLNNLGNTVANPMLYYYKGDKANNNWFSTTMKNGGELWKADEKTIYDPCPPGWRVPADTTPWKELLESKDPDSYWKVNYHVYDFGNLGGSYSLPGFRYDKSQSVYMKGEQSIYYTSTMTDTFHPKYQNGVASLIKLRSSENTLAFAGSIRCIKE